MTTVEQASQEVAYGPEWLTDLTREHKFANFGESAYQNRNFDFKVESPFWLDLPDDTISVAVEVGSRCLMRPHRSKIELQPGDKLTIFYQYKACRRSVIYAAVFGPDGRVKYRVRRGGRRI